MLGIFKYYWKEAIAYRAEYIISVLAIPLRFFVIVMIWTAVYSASSDQSIQGYSLANLITYFMISTFVFTANYDTVVQFLEQENRKGNFLVYLLKPMSFPWLDFLRKIANRAFAIVSEIIPVTIIFIVFFSEYFVYGNIPGILLAVVFSFIMSYLIHLLVGILTFYLVHVRSVGWLVDFFIHFASGVFVPLDLLPPALIAVSDLLPFKYLVFVPTKIYLGDYVGLELLFQYAMQLLWTLILLGLVYVLWKKAIRHFSGVGA